MDPLDNVPNRGVGKKWAWACCLTLLVMGVIPLGVGLYLMKPTTVDRRGDWAEFYETDVSRLATVPGDATILEATEIRDFMMGGGFRIVFTLPETKTPEEWMLVLTSGEGVGLREHKVSRYRYDKRESGDIYWLQYSPESQQYELRYHWD